MTSEHTLLAEDLSVGYGDRIVLHALDLELPTGAITAIVGANACGKSTLQRSMSRLLAPRSGRIVLDGRAIHRLPAKELARTVGLLPQSVFGRLAGYEMPFSDRGRKRKLLVRRG